MGNKDEKCISAGIGSAGIGIIGGTLLVACTGGAALIVGGIALGAGISGTVNSI